MVGVRQGPTCKPFWLSDISGVRTKTSQNMAMKKQAARKTITKDEDAPAKRAKKTPAAVQKPPEGETAAVKSSKGNSADVKPPGKSAAVKSSKGTRNHGEAGHQRAPAKTPGTMETHGVHPPDAWEVDEAAPKEASVVKPPPADETAAKKPPDAWERAGGTPVAKPRFKAAPSG